MNLARKHKISLITGIPLSGIDKEIIDFIQDKLTGLVRFEFKGLSNIVFYMKDERFILEVSHNRSLTCRYDDFWNILDFKFKLTYIEVQLIIRYMVENLFGISVDLPSIVGTHDYLYINRIEKAFVDSLKTI